MAPLGFLWASAAVFRAPAGTAFKHCFVVDAVPEQAHRDPGDPEPPKGSSKVLPKLKKTFSGLLNMQVECQAEGL